MELLLLSSVFSVVGDVIIQKFDHSLLLFVCQVFAPDLILEIVIELDRTFAVS